MVLVRREVEVRDERVGWVLGTEVVPFVDQGLSLSRNPRGEVPAEAGGDVAARYPANDPGEGRRPQGSNSGGREVSKGALRLRPEGIPIRPGKIGIGPPEAFGGRVAVEADNDGQMIRVEVGGGGPVSGQGNVSRGQGEVRGGRVAAGGGKGREGLVQEGEGAAINFVNQHLTSPSGPLVKGGGVPGPDCGR